MPNDGDVTVPERGRCRAAEGPQRQRRPHCAAMGTTNKTSGIVSTLLQLALIGLIMVVTAVVLLGSLAGTAVPVIGPAISATREWMAGKAVPPGSAGAPMALGGTSTPSPDPSTLVVAPQASMNGYARVRFGQAWTDDVDVEGGNNNCDTRNDILARDLTAVTTLDGCKVASGTLVDPYTAEIIGFMRGKDTSAAVQVDHIVALANSWVSGAWTWDLPALKQIANDPLNLLAVDGPANMGKGAKAADEWLPPNPAFQCTYVKRQVMVKNKYRLSVTAPEKAVMERFHGQC